MDAAPPDEALAGFWTEVVDFFRVAATPDEALVTPPPVPPREVVDVESCGGDNVLGVADVVLAEVESSPVASMGTASADFAAPRPFF